MFASVDAPPKTGGVALLAHRLSSVLTADTHSEGSVFIAPQGAHFPRADVPFHLYEDFQSDTSLRAGRGARLEDERIADLMIKVATYYELDNVVLWHPFYYGPGAIRAARALDLPVTVFVHGTELTSQLPNVRKKKLTVEPDLQSETLPDRLLLTLRYADRILTNSEYTAQLARNACGSTPVTAIGCGIDASLLRRLSQIEPGYSAEGRRLRRIRQGMRQEKTMIAVGRLVPHKNHIQMLELLAAMPDWVLIIVGDGPEYDAIVKRAGELGVDNRLEIRRNADDQEKYRLMQGADLGLLLSIYDENTGGYEGFGIVMLEYAAAGCVPVTNGHHGMADFGVTLEGALLALNDNRPVKAHAADLMQSAGDDALMQLKLSHARTLIEEMYTWERVGERAAEAMAGM